MHMTAKLGLRWSMEFHIAKNIKRMIFNAGAFINEMLLRNIQINHCKRPILPGIFCLTLKETLQMSLFDAQFSTVFDNDCVYLRHYNCVGVQRKLASTNLFVGI